MNNPAWQNLDSQEMLENTLLPDPFDEPLPDPNAILTVLNQYESPSPLIYEGCSYRYSKPPYMLFQDQANAKRRLRETYTQRLFLLLFGYSGCGKTTVLRQFADKYPGIVFYIDDFGSLSLSQLLLTMGKCVNLPLKLRTSSKDLLTDALKANPHIMFLFDEVDVFDTAGNLRKFDMLRKIQDVTGNPMVLCGTSILYNKLYSERNYEKFGQLLRRLDECEMKGMLRSDAANYLNMVCREENVCFTFQARQILEPLALNAKIGGIAVFTLIIGRAITLKRIQYYRSEGRSIPDSAECARMAIKEGLVYPGPDAAITLPPTPERLTIDEALVSACMADFKRQLLRRPMA
jgi:hypothetical protein